jgi:hypothetical protein
MNETERGHATLAELTEDIVGGLWGSTPDAAHSGETDVLVVRGADFRNWDERRARDAAPRRIPARSLERRRLSAGDLVLEVSGGGPAQPVGRILMIDDSAVASATRPLICSNFCRKIRLKPGVNPSFVKWALEWLYGSGHTERFQTSTTNIRNLRVDDFLRGTSIPLPDADVQTEVAARIEQLVALQRSSALHLAATGHALEQFRRSVLALACSGGLTADWRADNDVTNDAGRLERSLKESALLKPPPSPDGDMVGDLPPSWALATVGIAVERIEAGKSFTAQGRPAKEDEWGVVKVSAMSWGHFLHDENKAVPASQAIDPRNEIKDGDLLISRANTADLVGATVLVDQVRPRLLLSDKSLRLVLRPGIIPAWLNYVLGAPPVRSQFAARATGTSDSMRNLSQPKIMATTIPLPGTAEQREIVRRVKTLLDGAMMISGRTDAASQQLDRTTQAVLAKIFREELPERASCSS